MIINMIMLDNDNDVRKLFNNVDEKQEDFDWIEYDLEELGLPSVNQILDGVKKIESKVGLHSWRGKTRPQHYKGFGLTYNPDFKDKTSNRYNQVWGSDLLDQYYGAEKGSYTKDKKNTYYDTFGFRKVDKVIQEHLGFLIDKFNFHMARSRVAYIFGYGQEPNDRGWHVDEPTCKLLRVNIPIQTSDEYIMETKNKSYKLELGKVYLWNTMLPHRPAIIKKVETKQPRINVVIGLTPWLEYDNKKDIYTKNKYFGKPISEIVNERLFVK